MTEPLFSLDEQLLQIRNQHLYRSRKTLDSAQGVTVNIDGRRLVNFCSNDYLGLANHPEIVAAFKGGADTYGVGSGSAHLICGHSRAHHELEEVLAEFTGRQRALLFSTGYMANLAVITALLQQADAVFEDRLNHASLLDAGLFSGARFKRYPHCDSNSLQKMLINSDAERKMIVSDSVFSMDGDIAPVIQLAAIAQQQQAIVMLDDAHGFGVLGKNGAGVCEAFHVSQHQVPVLMATLGKAVGCAGAFIAGSEALIEFLIQKARTYIYTTAMPPATALAASAAIKIIRRENWRREQLQASISYFRTQAQQLGLPLAESQTAIQVLVVGDARKTLQLSDDLYRDGFLLSAIRPPTVPKNSSRLRITFSAEHQQHHIDSLLDALQKVACD